MFSEKNTLAVVDHALWDAVCAERVRQEDHLELIASENYASPAVLEAQGSILTNKYAEGYPGKRYYGGCEHVDVVEQLAIDRAKALFSADYVNVQPHSGSQANAAVMLALLQPGDAILGMSLSHGGHLTHGAEVSFSGKMYRAAHYGVDASGRVDYDDIANLARQHRPKLIIAGFSAYSQVLDWARFRAIADEVGAYLLVDMAHVAGLVAAGCYPSPLPYADVVTSTTHKTLRGPRGGLILAKANETIAKKLQSAVFPGLQGGPLMHVIAAKAVCFLEALQPAFKVYQEQVVSNAKTMAQVLIDRGYAVLSGGTENHLVLVDVTPQGITGKEAELILGQVHMTVNKNSIPNEPRSPFVTSGIRLGTPAVTTRGFKTEHIVQLTHGLADVLDQPHDDVTRERVKSEVLALCRDFPVYG